MTCKGVLCEAVALPVWLPLGSLYLGIYNLLDKVFVFGDVEATAAPAKQWIFVIPVTLLNAAAYYFLGSMAEWAWTRMAAKAKDGKHH